MARGHSGFWSNLVIIGLVILAGYNVWQISRLNVEVANLKRHIVAKPAAVVERTPNASALSKATDHLDRARKYLSKGDTAHASVELERGLLAIKKAGTEAAAPSQRAFEGMQRTVHDSLETLQRLKKALNKEPSKSEGG